MTINHLLQAIDDCNNGHLVFNLGNVRAFLHGKRWYPLRATINRGAEHANENSDLTTDRALVALVYLGVWTRVKDINFENQLPAEAQPDEISEETRRLSKILYQITR